MNPQKLMKQLQQKQERIQQEIAALQIEASSGGGMVTVVMDSMTFEQPVYVGNLVVLHACVTWTGRTSLEQFSLRSTVRYRNAMRFQGRNSIHQI